MKEGRLAGFCKPPTLQFMGMVGLSVQQYGRIRSGRTQERALVLNLFIDIEKPKGETVLDLLDSRMLGLSWQTQADSQRTNPMSGRSRVNAGL